MTDKTNDRKVMAAHSLGHIHIATIDAHAKAENLNRSAALRSIIDEWVEMKIELYEMSRTEADLRAELDAMAEPQF